MNIADELREWARKSTVRDVVLTTCPEQHAVHGILEHLLAIADRIDAEHERQLEVLYRDMSDAEYVKLPVDADGEYIHIGDVMEWPYGNGDFVVEGIGGNTLFYIDKDSNECEWTAAGDKHHHHAPTVEDVLTEMVTKLIERNELTNGAEQTIAEYASKLQLRGDA